jgi:transcription antitermination factor NusG
MSSAQILPSYSSSMPFDLSAKAESYWYALQTQPRYEKKVAAQLLKKGITTFLPVVSEVHRWSDRKKVIQVPLFTGYAFVRIVATPQERLLVLRTPGIVRFVGGNGENYPIPDKQIDDIRAILEQKVSCMLYPFLRVGQRVRIRGGCLDGIEGLLVALEGDRGLVISVDSILQSIAIRVEGYDLEILSPPSALQSGRIAPASYR